MRIIFIDQHPDEVEDLKQKLKGRASVELCETDEDVMGKLEEDSFDVLFIDYDINTRSMEQLNQTIQEQYPDIKRIISSRVLSTKFFKEHGKGKSQAFAYLKRPYNLEMIQETLGLDQEASSIELTEHTETKATSIDLTNESSDSSQSINFSEASQLFDHIFDEKEKEATKSKKITVKKPVKSNKTQSTEIDLSEGGLTPESSGFLSFSTSSEVENLTESNDSNTAEDENDSSSSGMNLSGLDQSMTDLQLDNSNHEEDKEEQSNPPPIDKSFTGTTIGTGLTESVEDEIDLGSIEDETPEPEVKKEQTLTATQLKKIPKPPEIVLDQDPSLTIQAQANSGAKPKEFKLDQDGIKPKAADLGTVEFSDTEDEDSDKTRIQGLNIADDAVTQAFQNKTDSQSATMDLFAQSEDAETELMPSPQEQATVLMNQFSHKDSKDYQEFLAFQKEELERMSANLKITRSDRENLLKKIEDLQEQNAELRKENINLRSETDELKIELELLRKRSREDLENANSALKMAEDKQRFMEEKHKKYLADYEKLNNRVRVDFNKIREREKELENQLDLIKTDSQLQIASREQKIIELRRKMDTLEFNMETISIQEQKIKEDKIDMEEKLRQLTLILKQALNNLEAPLNTSESKVEQLKKVNY